MLHVGVSSVYCCCYCFHNCFYGSYILCHIGMTLNMMKKSQMYCCACNSNVANDCVILMMKRMKKMTLMMILMMNLKKNLKMMTMRKNDGDDGPVNDCVDAVNCSLHD